MTLAKFNNKKPEVIDFDQREVELCFKRRACMISIAHNCNMSKFINATCYAEYQLKEELKYMEKYLFDISDFINRHLGFSSRLCTDWFANFNRRKENGYIQLYILNVMRPRHSA